MTLMTKGTKERKGKVRAGFEDGTKDVGTSMIDNQGITGGQEGTEGVEAKDLGRE